MHAEIIVPFPNFDFCYIFLICNSLVLLQGILCQSTCIRYYSISNYSNIIAIYVTVLCYYRGYYVRAVVFVIIVLVILVIIQLLMYQSCVIIGNIMLEQQYFVKGTMISACIYWYLRSQKRISPKFAFYFFFVIRTPVTPSGR